MENINHFLRFAPRPVKLLAFVWVITAAILCFKYAATAGSVASLSDLKESMSVHADEWQAFEDETIQPADTKKPKAAKKDEDDYSVASDEKSDNSIGFFNRLFNSFVNWLVDKAGNSNSSRGLEISSLDNYHQAKVDTAKSV